MWCSSTLNAGVAEALVVFSKQAWVTRGILMQHRLVKELQSTGFCGRLRAFSTAYCPIDTPAPPVIGVDSIGGCWHLGGGWGAMGIGDKG